MTLQLLRPILWPRRALANRTSASLVPSFLKVLTEFVASFGSVGKFQEPVHAQVLDIWQPMLTGRQICTTLATSGQASVSKMSPRLGIRQALAEVTSMPPFGLIGDSSIYCKGRKGPKRIGCQLQEQLETSGLWYYAIANAGVHTILQRLRDTPLTFETLGISYFGNDLTEGRIRPEVRCILHVAHIATVTTLNPV